MPVPASEYPKYLTEAKESHLAELTAFLRIPSISALAERKQDCGKAAAWLAERLQQAGLEHVKVHQTAGHPLVYGEWMHKTAAPTVLIYGHYDVQPVDPLKLWETPPFEPHVRNGRIYARGVSDDKGQLLAHVQALATMLAREGELPVNVKVLFEGEEEIGSPNLGRFVSEHRQDLAADVLVISDTGMVAPGKPTICCGLRGITTLEAHVYGAATDLHSGLYGGAVVNPLHTLAEIIAGLHDKNGRVTVPGFYDDVVELSAYEREQIAALPFDEDELMRRLGVTALVGEAGYSAMERISIRPTIEVNGMWGGFQGEGSKTVIPAQAHVKLSCRLVPNQDPQKIASAVAEHIQRACPVGARVQVELGHGGKPWACDPQTPVLQAAIRALSEAFAQPVALARLGGSIPIVETFASVLHLPVILMGFAPPDANAHAPNESMDLCTWELSRLAICYTWQQLGQLNLPK